MSGPKQTGKRASRFETVYGIIGKSILIFLAGHYLYGGAVYVRDLLRSSDAAYVDNRAASPVYADYPDINEYWTEFARLPNMNAHPYFHWKHPAFAGKYINIDTDGNRRTTGRGAAAKAVGGRKIMMLGGSTLWGTGSPDDKTIPSILQSLLGSPYEVYNYGEEGFVSTQELNYLLYQLARGNVPSAVIFYDGMNDGYAGAYSPAVPRDPYYIRAGGEKREPKDRNFFLRILETSNYMRLVGDVIAIYNRISLSVGRLDAWGNKIAPRIEANSAAVIDMYEAHIKQVKALARDYGFEAFFFWQPNLFSLSRKTVTSSESEIIETASPVLIASQQQVYRAAKERFSGREEENIFFLGDIFNNVDRPVYIDWHHVGPSGNEIIAQAIRRQVGRSPLFGAQGDTRP